MFSTAGRKALQSVEPAVPLSSAGVRRVHTESLSCVAPSATQKLGSVSAVRFLGDIVGLESMLFFAHFLGVLKLGIVLCNAYFLRVMMLAICPLIKIDQIVDMQI